VGVTGYDVYQGASLKGVSGTTYTVTGLTAATAYTFSIKKDAAGIHQLPVNCKCNYYFNSCDCLLCITRK
jgi:hypothetical protein